MWRTEREWSIRRLYNGPGEIMRTQAKRAKRQERKQGEGFEMNLEGGMPSPSEHPCDEWRRGGAEGKQADSRLKTKVVLPSTIGNISKGQASGWGNDEPEEAGRKMSKIRI